jgi:hypothetical protein
MIENVLPSGRAARRARRAPRAPRAPVNCRSAQGRGSKEELEGKRRMARKEFNDARQCTTATTPRPMRGAGLNELGKRPEDVVARAVNGDSCVACVASNCEGVHG